GDRCSQDWTDDRGSGNPLSASEGQGRWALCVPHRSRPLHLDRDYGFGETRFRWNFNQLTRRYCTMTDKTILESACRTVTTEEIDHLHEFGWVKLKSFVDPDVVRQMLNIARDKMGDDADSNPLD